MIVIGTEQFKTKKAALDRCRGIIAKTANGSRVDDRDSDFLGCLLLRHPEAEAKIGPGVEWFTVAMDPRGTRHFVLVRVDGSRSDFSFIACMSPPSREAQAIAAMRFEVSDFVIAFKAKAFAAGGVACALTGVNITEETSHVDHAPPWTFAALSRAFIAEHGVPRVNETVDGDTITRLVDPAVALLWRSYHDERAQLRMLSTKANLSTSRKVGPVDAVTS